MNISEVFIRRPIPTSLIMLAIASLPGGDPTTMASAVATPRRFGSSVARNRGARSERAVPALMPAFFEAGS